MDGSFVVFVSHQKVEREGTQEPFGTDGDYISGGEQKFPIEGNQVNYYLISPNIMIIIHSLSTFLGYIVFALLVGPSNCLISH